MGGQVSPSKQYLTTGSVVAGFPSRAVSGRDTDPAPRTRRPRRVRILASEVGRNRPLSSIRHTEVPSQNANIVVHHTGQATCRDGSTSSGGKSTTTGARPHPPPPRPPSFDARSDALFGTSPRPAALARDVRPSFFRKVNSGPTVRLSDSILLFDVPRRTAAAHARKGKERKGKESG